MLIGTIVDEGLGNASYVVDVGQGRGLVVDPSRDPGPYLQEAAARGLRIAFVAETHLHADFVSGSRELQTLGATVLASAEAGLGFPHRGLRDGEEIDLGGLTLRALATPGHTPEHLAYLFLDGSRPVAVFTGGALLRGSVARTDLLGPDRTEPLGRALYRSVRDRLFVLPEEVRVLPTHGAGASFCAAVPADGDEVSTTIGKEKTTNRLLQLPDEDAFVGELVRSYSSYPLLPGPPGGEPSRTPRVRGGPPGTPTAGGRRAPGRPCPRSRGRGRPSGRGVRGRPRPRSALDRAPSRLRHVARLTRRRRPAPGLRPVREAGPSRAGPPVPEDRVRATGGRAGGGYDQLARGRTARGGGGPRRSRGGRLGAIPGHPAALGVRRGPHPGGRPRRAREAG